ncbi:MAG: hypothetical protein ACFFG0_15560 [Candidatus Thorarchaeota archaeon]
MADFEIKHRLMTCGSDEAESRKYFRLLGKDGKLWLVANQPNAADNIYVEGSKSDKNTGFEGFGGRTLTFTLVHGQEIKLKGPWHSNANSLLYATGVDIRDKHLTWGCIGKSWKSGPDWQGTILDVIHMDKEPVIGEFNRIEKLANEVAKELGMELYYYKQSQGGSTSGSTRLFDASNINSKANCTI